MRRQRPSWQPLDVTGRSRTTGPEAARTDAFPAAPSATAPLRRGPADGDPARGAAPVALAGVRRSYGAVNAVDGVSLTVPAGQVVALLGPNGAGKSTTIDMLLGLTTQDAGTVSLFGLSPRRACAEGLVAAMLQNGGLLPFVTVETLLDTLRGLYPHPLTTAEAMRRAGVSDLAGLRTEKLSGGQRQRVRFATALLPDPQLLVLDEPTAAMDVSARQAFWAETRDWAAEGRTVLFATHYLAEADDFADRIVLLRAGRVVADGTTTEVKALVGGRVIRATLPRVDDHLLAALGRLPGVSRAARRGDTIELRCADSDAALRALLAEAPAVRDLEITGAGLEDAFMVLTADSATPPAQLAGSAVQIRAPHFGEMAP